MEEFARSFYEADTVIVTPVYPAGEEPVAGVDAEAVCSRIGVHGHRDARLAGSLEEALAMVRATALDGDMIVTLGAGDVNRLCRSLIDGEEEAPPARKARKGSARAKQR